MAVTAISNLDIKMIKNNDLIIKFDVTDLKGNVIDISGMTIKWSVRKTIHDAPVITKMTNNSTITMPAPLTGVFYVHLTAADTANLTEGSYYHEAIVTDGTGKSVTLTNSQLNVGRFFIRDQYTVQN